MTDLSVIISTFNRSEDLKIALDCLKKQVLTSPVDYEVLIIDNNSTDDTKSVVESFSPAFQGRLKYFFEPRQGKPFAMNLGIKECKGEIIVMTDDDCSMESDYLENVYNTFKESGPNIGFIGGKIIPRWVNCSKPEWFDNLEPDWFKDFFWGPLAILDYGDKPFIINWDLYESQGKKLLYGANMAARKEIFLKYGDFDHEKRITEDMEFQLRLLRAGVQVLYTPRVRVFHKVTAKRLRPGCYYRWYLERGFYMEINEVYEKKPYYPFGIPFYFVARTCKLFAKSVFARPLTEKMYHRCRAIFNIGQMVQIAKMPSKN